MRKSLLNLAVLAAFAAPAIAIAQTAPAAPAVPTLDKVLDASGIAMDGYIDAAYSRLSGTGMFTSGVANRVFDTERNSFLLHQAALNIGKQPKEGFGGFANITLGKDADVIAPFDSNPGATKKFDITQAYAQYASGAFTVIAGKYVTAAGAEVIKSPANVNYSRSILFGYAIPFTHTGARATYAASDTFSVFGGVNNGWDNLRDTNVQKTGELGLSFTPIKDLTIAAVDYLGSERVGGLTPVGPEGRRNLFDIVATYAVTDKLSLTLNYDNGSQKNTATVTPSRKADAKWTGFAGYATYQISDTWRLAVRGERFDDKDGYRTGVAQKWNEGTLTLAYLPSKSMELRGEVRRDGSNVASFVKTDGTVSKSQTSFGLEAIYKF